MVDQLLTSTGDRRIAEPSTVSKPTPTRNKGVFSALLKDNSQATSPQTLLFFSPTSGHIACFSENSSSENHLVTYLGGR